MEMEPAVILMIIFGSVGFVVYTWLSSRHKERMMMIEKGTKPADLKTSNMAQFFKPSPLSSLKWGLLASFVGGGLVIANILDRQFYFHDSIYFASMLICGGLGLIIFYFIASKKVGDDDN